MVNNNNSGGLLAGSCLTNSNILTIICTFLQNNGGNYLEIGVYDGQTLCHVAHQNPSKTIYGIDPFISDGNTGQIRGISLTAQEENCMRNVRKYRNVCFYKTKSRTFYENLSDSSAASMNVAAVYIDGSHHCEDVIVDIKLAMKLIGTKKGFVVFDDLHIPDVKAAVIAANFLYNGKFQRWNFPEHYIN